MSAMVESDASNADAAQSDRITALAQVFDIEAGDAVNPQDGPMGDYRIHVESGCLTSETRTALGVLGFEVASIHAHASEGEDGPDTYLIVYLNDTEVSA